MMLYMLMTMTAYKLVSGAFINAPQAPFGVQQAFPPTGPIYGNNQMLPGQFPFQQQPPQTFAPSQFQGTFVNQAPTPLPALISPLPQSRHRERQQIAWLEYLATIFMDVQSEWAVTDVNRDIFRAYQRDSTSSKPGRFFKSLADRIAAKAERFKTRVKAAIGLDERVRLIFLALKAGKVAEAYKHCLNPKYQMNQSDDLVKMIVATMMIVLDAINPRSIVRFWSPSFGLTARHKLLVLNYFDRLMANESCFGNEPPPLQGVPYGDSIRLRLLAILNRPLDPMLRGNFDIPSDEVALSNLSSYYLNGELCGAGEVRQSFRRWFTTPRLPQYARFFARAANLCQGDLAYRNYNDFCQVNQSLPMALLLSAGCPQSIRLEPTSNLERLFWAQLWIGDCGNARGTLVNLRDNLSTALLENPSITIRYNYLVQSLEQCHPSDRTEGYSGSFFQGILKLLVYGHYGDAMFEWRMFDQANCRQQGPLSEDIELLVRLAANPRAVYLPCLTAPILTFDNRVNLEILRKADKYANSSRPGGGRFMASLLGSVRSEPAIRLRMKAAMIANQLDLARELARLLPRDQEAAEIRACTSLCSSRYSACRANKKYRKLQERSRVQSVAIQFGAAVSEAVCRGVSEISFDPISIKYDLQLTVQDQLQRIARELAAADLRTRFIDPQTGFWLGQRFHNSLNNRYAMNAVIPSNLMTMPFAPGLHGNNPTVLPVMNGPMF